MPDTNTHCTAERERSCDACKSFATNRDLGCHNWFLRTTPIRFMKALMVVIVPIWAGCCPLLINDPGGGTVHVPPSFIPAGQPFTVTIECVAISGRGDRRFRDAKLSYRQAGTQNYSDVRMKFSSNAGTNPLFQGDLPPMEAGVILEYYISYYFDGEQRKRYFPPVPVK